jgi:hypothetical protein
MTPSRDSRRFQTRSRRWAKTLEVFHVPRVDRLRLGLECTVREERIVNCASHYSQRGRLFDRFEVFVLVERYQSQALSNVCQKQHCLIATDSRLAWHSGDRRIHLGKTVDAATGFEAPKLNNRWMLGS